jgi:subtilisin family serine protease
MGMRAWLLATLIVLVAAPVAQASDPLRSRQWGLDMIRADAAHAVTTGTGAVVAVIDTGVEADHPDLAGQTLPGHDFVETTTRHRTATGTGRT